MKMPNNGAAERALNSCGALGPNRKTGGKASCRRNKGHVKHHSKYQRQHCDTKNVPALYWDPTEEELESEL